MPQEDQAFVNSVVDAHDVAMVLDTFAMDTNRKFQGWATGENGNSQTQTQPSYQDLQLAAATQTPAAESARSTLPQAGEVMTDNELWDKLTDISNAELMREAR